MFWFEVLEVEVHDWLASFVLGRTSWQEHQAEKNRYPHVRAKKVERRVLDQFKGTPPIT